MRLLQIEFIKLFRPSTYILLGIMLALFISAAYIGLHITGGTDIGVLLKSIDGNQVSALITIFSIFVVMNIGAEYSENTLRRSIIEGYTRDEFFMGKLLLVFTGAVLLLLLQKLVLLVSAGIAGNFKDCLDYLNAAGIIAQLLRIIFYGLFSFFLAFVTRGIAIGIVVYFVWDLVETLIHALLKFKYPGMDWNIYLPVSSLNNMLGGTQFVALQFILVPVAYQLFMMLCPYWLFLRRDIK